MTFQDAPPEYELIEHLDWEEQFACEAKFHQSDQNATYYVELSHPKCGFSVKEFWCLPCYELMRLSLVTVKYVLCDYAPGQCCGVFRPVGEFSLRLIDALM